MSYQPLRHEPGPRDWTPAPESPAPIKRRAASPGPSLGVGALVLGVISVAVSAIYIPASDQAGTIILSALGLFAILLGVQAARAQRFGTRLPRRLGQWGAVLGCISLASTAALLANGWLGLSIPALPDLTRALVSPAAESPIDQPGVSAAQGPSSDADSIAANPADITIPTPVFESADAEFEYLAQSLGTTVFLIEQAFDGGTPDELFMSTTGYSYVSSKGDVMVVADDAITPAFGVHTAGGYTLSLTGTRFGTTAIYDSRVGTIVRG